MPDCDISFPARLPAPSQGNGAQSRRPGFAHVETENKIVFSAIPIIWCLNV